MDDLTQRLSSEAVCFKLLGRILYREPEAEAIDELISLDVFDSLPFGSDEQESQLGLGLLQSWQKDSAQRSSAEVFDEVKSDYFRLFLGIGKPEATIWESVYFTHDRTLFGKKTLEVRNWYKRYGLELELKNREPDDHLGLELLFIAHLVDQAVIANEQNDKEKLKKLEEDTRSFITEHPLAWVDQWLAMVQKHAKTDYYKGIAYVTKGILLAATKAEWM